MNQAVSKLQKTNITIRSEAATAVSVALHNAGIDYTRLVPLPCDMKNEYVTIEFCLSGSLTERAIDTILVAARSRDSEYFGEVRVTSLGPYTDQNPCGEPGRATSDEQQR